jgi:hypothetical protein
MTIIIGKRVVSRSATWAEAWELVEDSLLERLGVVATMLWLCDSGLNELLDQHPAPKNPGFRV